MIESAICPICNKYFEQTIYEFYSFNKYYCNNFECEAFEYDLIQERISKNIYYRVNKNKYSIAQFKKYLLMKVFT